MFIMGNISNAYLGCRGATPDISPLWYQRKSEKRATTNELINQLRYELWSATLKTNFTGFSQKSDPDQNGIKCDHPLESAVFLSIK